MRWAAAKLLLACALTLAAAGGAQAATYAKGVDVSHWQGSIQWLSVAAGGYTFAFAKATEGRTLVDATYTVNRAGAGGVGMRVGAYHFARPAGSGEAALVANAIAQADFFLDVAQPQPGELPPVLDLETRAGLSPSALQTWTRAWLDHVAARTGVAAHVYTSPNFWKTAVGDSTSVAAAGYPLWVAHWTTQAAPLLPASNWGGRSWTFWQFTNKLRAPGFLNPVDGNRFRGLDPTAAAIRPYPTTPPAASTPPTIVGTAQTGRALAAVPGTWTGGKPLVFSYQWLRCDASGGGCAAVDGATAETYVPGIEDAGHALTVTVTARSASGAASASAPPTTAVGSAGGAAARPAATTPPTVSGTPQAGQTLTASAGAWNGSPTTFAYQWRRCTPQCTAIAGAAAAAYTLTPGDIGATISLVVTATGRGGSTPATATPTAPVAPAPVPPPATGSAVAQPGAAGAVATSDGAATLTWQPGAVAAGSTVSLAAGRVLAFAVSPTVAQLAWPVELVYTAPVTGVVGYSTGGAVWRAPVRTGTPGVPPNEIVAAYVDGAGLTHVFLRVPARLRVFPPGAWGDPSLVGEGPPTPRLVGPLRLTRLRTGVVTVAGRVRVPSQAHLWLSVQGPSRQSVVRRPGSVQFRLRVPGKRLRPGTRATLRIAARDPWGRRAQLLVRLRAP